MLPVTVFMFCTYISMKSHHTQKGLEGSAERKTGRGEGHSLYKRTLSHSPSENKKRKERKLSKIFEVSV